MTKLYGKGNYKALIAAGIFGCGLIATSASGALAKQPTFATESAIGERIAGTYLPPVFDTLPKDAI